VAISCIRPAQLEHSAGTFGSASWQLLAGTTSPEQIWNQGLSRGGRPQRAGTRRRRGGRSRLVSAWGCRRDRAGRARPAGLQREGACWGFPSA